MVHIHGSSCNNGLQFMSKFFLRVWHTLGMENIFMTTYHPQCVRQMERLKRTIINAWRHYVVNRPWEWDLYLNTLTNASITACNTQIHSSTGFAPLELALPNLHNSLRSDSVLMTKSAILCNQYIHMWPQQYASLVEQVSRKWQGPRKTARLNSII